MASDKAILLAQRLADIMVKMNYGKSYSTAELSEEYGVEQRTINNDIDRLREAGLDIDKTGNKYSLDPSCLGKLKLEDIEVFSEVMGLVGLYPSLSQKLLKRLLKADFNIYKVIGHEYEDINTFRQTFESLETYICRNLTIRYTYKDKKYSNVKPYKLINQNGIWYLAAVTEDNKLKSFHIGALKFIAPYMNGQFTLDPEVLNKIDESGSIWFEEKLETIIINVSSNVSSYFKRRPLFPNQKIIEEKDDGSIIVECRTGNIKDFIPKILYWIPDVKILSPENIKQQIFDKINIYINNKEV
jgi:predicted DNA-binding transcriptional regulator YafY